MKHKKENSTLFVSFNIADKTAQYEDKRKVITLMEIIIPHARQVDSNSNEEIIYAIDVPDSPEDDFKNRTFLFRLKSVFLQAQEYSPHFTTYAF